MATGGNTGNVHALPLRPAIFGHERNLSTAMRGRAPARLLAEKERSYGSEGSAETQPTPERDGERANIAERMKECLHTERVDRVRSRTKMGAVDSSTVGSAPPSIRLLLENPAEAVMQKVESDTREQWRKTICRLFAALNSRTLGASSDLTEERRILGAVHRLEPRLRTEVSSLEALHRRLLCVPVLAPLLQLCCGVAVYEHCFAQEDLTRALCESVLCDQPGKRDSSRTFWTSSSLVQLFCAVCEQKQVTHPLHRHAQFREDAKGVSSRVDLTLSDLWIERMIARNRSLCVVHDFAHRLARSSSASAAPASVTWHAMCVSAGAGEQIVHQDDGRARRRFFRTILVPLTHDRGRRGGTFFPFLGRELNVWLGMTVFDGCVAHKGTGNGSDEDRVFLYVEVHRGKSASEDPSES